MLVTVDDHLFDTTVLDDLRFADEPLHAAAAQALLELVELDTTLALTTPVGAGGRALSGGERRRIALARPVAAAPPILLLDEPSAGLEPAQGRRMLIRVRDGLPATTLVVAQHDGGLPFTGPVVLVRLLGRPSG